ncbi:NADH dehydrogenase [ubiquinone] 1 alpha subcomplex subunit 10, mitochondrial [Dufourea novaeangliae]|uniref:NADH dehydrogenase [ubiquinone] 1 alpha subcomplex subunit 10, mitochondrial n=2 Tax=Dufourea novaeangliae TaxID=178035 RepID=A0A154PC41_DUFNO|nr:NADH dehydrogenase [ubiquinone] 1 alpha subcomplex subunit 10, mitochondrial [Dufourea novaeangliae]
MTRLSLKIPGNKPPPFPYWKKTYNIIRRVMDPITYRFDENTRLVVVDGLPAVGKSKFCEKIADAFGMLYMPAPTQDDLYINRYGFDVRTLDDQLPFMCKSFDVPRFLENPHDKRAGLFQEQFFLMRMDQYFNALLHILSTGQGVVLNRSVFSEIIFAEAMLKAGYIHEDVYLHYVTMRNTALKKLPRPHLAVYLDVPAELVQEKIKQRGRPEEINTKVFSTQFLNDMRDSYREKYLKQLATHSHLLIYDWSKEADYNIVVEDIEAIDFENYENKKLKDWEFDEAEDVVMLRYKCDTDYRLSLYCKMLMAGETVMAEDLIQTAEDREKSKKVMAECDTEQFSYGFNPKAGDKILFKGNPRDLYYFRRNSQDFVNRSKYMS